MELHHIESFLAVAEAHHFGRAGDQLHLSQPALSRQIQQLERELGVRLFERTARGVALSPAGQTFLGHARRVMAEIAAARIALRQPGADLASHVLLGCFDSASAYVMPDVLATLHHLHPRLVVSMTTLGTDQAVKFTRQGDIDGAIVTLPVPTEGIWTTHLYREELVLVAPTDHPLTAERRVPVRSLDDEQLITFRSFQNTRRLIDQAFATAGCAPAVVVEIESVEAIKGAVRTGLGVAVLGAIGLAGRPRTDGLVARPLSPPIYRSIGLIAPVDRRADPVLGEVARATRRWAAARQSHLPAGSAADDVIPAESAPPLIRYHDLVRRVPPRA